MSKIVVSDDLKGLAGEMRACGYEVIASEKIDVFHKPEQKHVDMQLLKIRQRIFLLREAARLQESLHRYNPVICLREAKRLYPENILLNCLYFNNTLYGKLKYTDKTVLDFCKSEKIALVNVNQGYTRCSTLAVGENAAITADSSIAEALTENGADVLKIRAGSIALKGFDYGFIGGCSGRIDDGTIAFCGNICAHPDYNSIKEFIEAHNKSIYIFCKNQPLTDVGGFILLD